MNQLVKKEVGTLRKQVYIYPLLLMSLWVILVSRFFFKEFADYLDILFIIVLLFMAASSYRRKKNKKIM
ncbi:hypothetical protein RRU94_07630 [Domibacillus sp. DTU_2020_1001157_1_SI_ALB_TIR_016]|uniref:hypothetical protein n=1 Tax=Domibacillus sp. DTU_2020_1001157_1_SI_ALB_TIR_016 TaxID=3077789 RepID=UPI0028F0E037|nr:hypothetical protein [Domibacillus sp. DTU_2020_1001157_1_SI_ALB_TIR_016]WNS78320.1 hypothetical protein RRU94_07630 [Domibacillus sp. DTU_2020_1001157_1_SI_ALB_TIR_016]